MQTPLISSSLKRKSVVLLFQDSKFNHQIKFPDNSPISLKSSTEMPGFGDITSQTETSNRIVFFMANSVLRFQSIHSRFLKKKIFLLNFKKQISSKEHLAFIFKQFFLTKTHKHIQCMSSCIRKIPDFQVGYEPWIPKGHWKLSRQQNRLSN